MFDDEGSFSFQEYVEVGNEEETEKKGEQMIFIWLHTSIKWID